MGSTGTTDSAAVADQAVRAFADAYHRGPDVTWSAPGRANLIGEHTDYNDGFVLPFAITQRTAAAAARRDDGVITVGSTLAPVPSPCGWRTSRLAPSTAGPGTRSASRGPWRGSATRRGAGADLFIHSDVPAGAGLSSSAALEIASAGALAALWGLELSTAELAKAGHRAENEIVGAPTGVMDEYASLLGQPDAAVFLDCRSLRARSVPLPLAEAGLTLVLTDTGERHAHAPAATPPAAPPASGARPGSASPRCATSRSRTCPRAAGRARRGDLPPGQARGDRGRPGGGDGRRPRGGRPGRRRPPADRLALLDARRL